MTNAPLLFFIAMILSAAAQSVRADAAVADRLTGSPGTTVSPSQNAPSTAQDARSADAVFAAFVANFRAAAIAQGVKPETYDRSMAGIARNADIERADLQQPEFERAIWDYLDTVVSDKRIAQGAQLLSANAAVIETIEKRFGVPGKYLVAIWGAETNYGATMGHYNMFEALATLAYNGPRLNYGRQELIAALKMEERENLDPKTMTSSWAGAFGQTQFVPSSYLKDGVDGDGDGKIDLWHSPADALASTAKLLSDEGWKRESQWGYEVVLPSGFDYADADIDTRKTLAQWKAEGVRKASGDPLPATDESGAIIVPAGTHGPAFIVFDDFRTILKYNNTQSYALAVCLLADRIAGLSPIRALWPRGEAPLNRDERIAFQNDLKKLGYDPGDADGILGRQARAALRVYQKAHGIPADGFATVDLLVRMEREIAARGG